MQFSLFDDKKEKAPESFPGLSYFDLVIINTSGGKDSIASISEIMYMAHEEGYPLDKIHLSHQDLQDMEWPGVIDLVKNQAKFFGLPIHFSRRKTADGIEETILDYTLRRGKWPSPQQRWCTSDFKRGPGQRVLTKLSRDYKASKVLYVFGFRKQESDARAKRKPYVFNKGASTKSRTVYDFLPIHEWTEQDVWERIKMEGIPYHYAYDLGMPRLSCAFCIYAPQEALMLAAHHNPELFEDYLQVEKTTGHDFSFTFSLRDIKERLEKEGVPSLIKNWSM